MVGPRVAARRSMRLAPFAQVLVGAVRASASILDQSDDVTDLGVQMGGGVDLSLAPWARLRLGGDYRRVLGDFEGDQLRASASLVVPLGRFP
jgi:hypothetical protein